MRLWLALGLLLLPLLAQARSRKRRDVVEEVPPTPEGDYLWPCENCHDEMGTTHQEPPELVGCVTCHVVLGESDGTDHKPLAEATNETCVECHDTTPPKHAHMPVEGDTCTMCHDPHSRGEPPHLRAGTEADTCLVCHEEVEQVSRPHTALRLGRCGTCHLAHGGDYARLLKAPAAALCEECHEAQHANTREHLPASTCSTCHTHHGGEHPHGLKATQGQVCGLCHPSVATEPQVHSAVVLSRCSGCHDPHGSQVAHLLYDEPQATVCYRCHANDITGRPTEHPPVAAGHCQICHDPHTAAAPGVLHTSIEVTCRQCHAEAVAESYPVPHLALDAWGCTGCHDPHASDAPGLLKGPVNEVCSRCHPDYADGYHISSAAVGGAHPITGEADPLVPGRELSCISCHAPHGGDKPHLWYRVEDELSMCAECHGRK